MHICKDSLSASILSLQGESLSGEAPDTLLIPRNNKINKTPNTSIIREKPIKEPVNPRKRAKENTFTDV